MRLRRSPHTFLYLEDGYDLDLTSLLQGGIPRRSPGARIVAMSIVTGERHDVSLQDLTLLLSLPSDDWVEVGVRDAVVVDRLAQQGLLVTDSADGQLTELRERDTALSRAAWNPYGALYHYMTQWSGFDTDDSQTPPAELTERRAVERQAFTAEHGVAPGPFTNTRHAQHVPLRGAERDEPLFRLLTRRRTTRAFNQDRAMSAEDLETILRYVFGCHGYGRTVADEPCIRRTSPSAGSLHPVEVYPIVSNVAGVRAGIYHYGVRDHALGLLRDLDPGEARGMATTFMCGQPYLGHAHVSFILTARFHRSYWKYRRHPRAYAAILMDAAHLSQTLYLVAEDLNLGAFVTIMINGRDIETELGLDGVEEGAIALVGCGVKDQHAPPVDPAF